MEPITPESPEAQSADLVADNIAQLKALFPELVTEAADGVSVNVDVLKQLVGDQTVSDFDEKYGLNWHGKRAARKLALTPSLGTLRPCPEESKDWETTQNLFIEGDNLEVLKLLQKSYAGKVKLIYIDPPYNTGKDFVYPDNFKDNIRNYKELTGQVDGEGRDISTNKEASGRFHTDWLNMMYPRLKVAKSLLREDGVIFISIDDNEHTNLRILCDDVFGEENFISTICWQKFHSVKSNAEHNVSQSHDFILCYAKQAEGLNFEKLPMSDKALEVYKNPDNDPRGRWRTAPLTVSLLSGARGAAYKKTGKSTGLYTITAPNGKEHKPSAGRCWISESTVKKLIDDNRIWWGKDGNATPMQKIFLEEKGGTKSISTFWRHEEYGSNKKANEELKALFGDNDDDTENFPTPKPSQLIKTMVGMMGDDSAIVLDFFAGSATTAHAVLDYNLEKDKSCSFILVQLPEEISSGKYKTIAEIGKERIRRVSNNLKSKLDKIDDKDAKTKRDLGFKVFKLDSSNIKAWNAEAIAAAQSGDEQAALLDEQVDHLLADRTEDDILYELLLKLGLDLCVPIEQREIAGKTVYSVGAGVLMVCLAESISYEDSETLAQGIVDWHQELAPATEVSSVFRDSGFADDKAKANTTAILDQAGLKKVRSI